VTVAKSHHLFETWWCLHMYKEAVGVDEELLASCLSLGWLQRVSVKC